MARIVLLVLKFVSGQFHQLDNTLWCQYPPCLEQPQHKTDQLPLDHPLLISWDHTASNTLWWQLLLLSATSEVIFFDWWLTGRPLFSEVGFIKFCWLGCRSLSVWNPRWFPLKSRSSGDPNLNNMATVLLLTKINHPYVCNILAFDNGFVIKPLPYSNLV